MIQDIVNKILSGCIKLEWKTSKVQFEDPICFNSIDLRQKIQSMSY